MDRFQAEEMDKKVILIEPNETTITLLSNWLPWDSLCRCDRSTDSNNLKVAMKISPHAGKLPVTPLFKDGLECDPCNFHPISVLLADKKKHASLMCISTFVKDVVLTWETTGYKDFKTLC